MKDSIKKLILSFENNSITEKRKLLLDELTKHIQQKINSKELININFICTHNSRRSILGQVWFQTLAHEFGLKNTFSYSGGMEQTAIAKPIIETLINQGFDINILGGTENHIYVIKFDRKQPSIIGFSKGYQDDFNPKDDLIAVLVCSDADTKCPVIFNSEKRVAITYDDPKSFDGTELQKQKYNEISIEIASDIHYIFSNLNISK